MTNQQRLYSFGRALFADYPQRLRYYGVVSTHDPFAHQNRRDRNWSQHLDADVACSLPCASSSEACHRARDLAALIAQQGN